MCLTDIIRSAAEIEFHLHAIQVLHHRKREPCVRSASLTEEEAVRTAVAITDIHRGV